MGARYRYFEGEIQIYLGPDWTRSAHDNTSWQEFQRRIALRVYEDRGDNLYQVLHEKFATDDPNGRR